LLIAGLIGSFFMFSDTSLRATGPTAVSDYRELPARDVQVDAVVGGLDAPWAFDWLPNGDMIITERFGAVRIVRDGEVLTDPVSGVPDVFAAGPGGWMDVHVHPAFANIRPI